MAKTLLVVDDEVSFLEVVQLKFKKEIETKEYEILTASSGEEALKKIEEDREHKIDLLLTDLKMPAASIDGFKLIRILREQNICLKKLVISAYADQENFRMALKENVVDFLAKPINLLELKPLVEEILQLPDPIDPQSTKVNVNTLYKLVRARSHRVPRIDIDTRRRTRV
jgi:YesN/AraC family two-component response regulator